MWMNVTGIGQLTVDQAMYIPCNGDVALARSYSMVRWSNAGLMLIYRLCLLTVRNILNIVLYNMLNNVFLHAFL